ncbi:MAG: immunoglobulin-like domain-containing protein [Fastidiosipilaceae bacterium]|jgi:hypothetical protein
MKKIIICCLFLVLSILTSCQSPKDSEIKESDLINGIENNDVFISIVGDEVSMNDSLKLAFKNNNNQPFYFGERYRLEYKDETWENVDLSGYHFSDILYSIQPEETIELVIQIPIDKMKNSGDYRLTFDFHYDLNQSEFISSSVIINME